MNTLQRVPIVRNEAFTIYGKVVGPLGKLGRYEVVAEHQATERHEFATFAEAEQLGKQIKHHFDEKNKKK